jgi:hydroxymethylbilane synthase
VVERLRATDPDLEIQVRLIRTRGDLVRDRALSQVGGKGLFVKELENSLLAAEIELAVHSLKDMPTELPSGLALAAIPERADPRDALLAREGESNLLALPTGARVGTSSLRRRSQLLAARPDLEVLDLRGNVDTRLRKLHGGEYDAVVLAAAGLIRLGRAEAIGEYLPADLMLPAAGQGALCAEVRADDEQTCALLAPLDHRPTRQATQAERAFLRRLEGGCQVPIGAYAVVEGDQLYLRGLIASLDGHRVVKDELRGPATKADLLGVELAERVLAAGGEAVLEEIGRGG